ncbi:MAG TPA: hypothetical protein VE860_06725 [Chthoniobacterales bacterium]|nr:hypothetical protein [Chthoniobacterales bacterium]
MDLTSLVNKVVAYWNKQNGYYEVKATPNGATGEIDIRLIGPNMVIGTIGFRDDLFNLHQQHGVLSARHTDFLLLRNFGVRGDKRYRAGANRTRTRF